MEMQNVTVNLYINAWLDRSNPFLSIHNKYNDELLARFNSKEILEVIEQGDITIEDLRSTNTKCQLEVIATLLAKKTQKVIEEQMRMMRFNKRNKYEKVTSLFPKFLHHPTHQLFNPAS